MTLNTKGTLYLVATPIGNLEDITHRAIAVLGSVDIIAAEDTRHSKPLLNHYGISTPLLAYHDHNETSQSEKLLNRMLEGASVALISDAGTPLINDPGFRLVARAHENDISVVPIPGACAAIAAMCASGLTANRFTFEGFPSPKHVSRIKQFQALENDPRTLVFYVSCHKVIETLQDMTTVFGQDREVTYARELTKTFETIRKTTLQELSLWVAADPNQSKGEIVVVVSGAETEPSEYPLRDAMLAVLVDELPIKQAAQIAARITGGSKNELYKLALTIKKDT